MIDAVPVQGNAPKQGPKGRAGGSGVPILTAVEHANEILIGYVCEKGNHAAFLGEDLTCGSHYYAEIYLSTRLIGKGRGQTPDINEIATEIRGTGREKVERISMNTRNQLTRDLMIGMSKAPVRMEWDWIDPCTQEGKKEIPTRDLTPVIDYLLAQGWVKAVN